MGILKILSLMIFLASSLALISCTKKPANYEESPSECTDETSCEEADCTIEGNCEPVITITHNVSSFSLAQTIEFRTTIVGAGPNLKACLAYHNAVRPPGSTAPVNHECSGPADYRNIIVESLSYRSKTYDGITDTWVFTEKFPNHPTFVPASYQLFVIGATGEVVPGPTIQILP